MWLYIFIWSGINKFIATINIMNITPTLLKYEGNFNSVKSNAGRGWSPVETIHLHTLCTIAGAPPRHVHGSSKKN